MDGTTLESESDTPTVKGQREKVDKRPRAERQEEGDLGELEVMGVGWSEPRGYFGKPGTELNSDQIGRCGWCVLPLPISVARFFLAAITSLKKEKK